ncbi:hypothetical protein ES703_17440 [subsurface metagenome]
MIIEDHDKSGLYQRKESRHTLTTTQAELWGDSLLEFRRLRWERSPEAMIIKNKVAAAVAAIRGDVADHIELAIELAEEEEGPRIHFNWFEVELRQKKWQFEYDDELYHRSQPDK